jgi:hypothetical protein
MKLLRDLSPQLALAGIVALQISCGDSTAPGPTAASISANSSTTLAAAPGTQVVELPSVIVRDASGNPVAGVAVNFAVTAGGGTVTGSHATSSTAGIATVGSWTLGPTQGATNTLVASAGNLSVTVTATGADPCSNLSTLTLGTTANGDLSPGDCALSDGSFVDFYQISLPTAGTYLFDETSAAFDSYLVMFNATGRLVGINDDVVPGNNVNSRIKAILPAGTFIVGANSFDAGKTGSYTLASAASTAEVTNCEDVFVVAGTSTAQSLSSSDCTANGILADEYLIFMQQGQSITVSMSSTAFDSYLELHADGSSAILASNDNIDGTTQNAQFAFTATSTGFYIIRARSVAAGATGAYTLAIQ